MMGDIFGALQLDPAEHPIPLPHKYTLRRIAGVYQVPTIKHRGRKVPVKVVLQDPSVADLGKTPHMAPDTQTVVITKAELERMRRRAADVLGVSVGDVRSTEEAEADYTGSLGYEIVLPVPFEKPLDATVMFPSLKSTLRHELAHAMDEYLRQRDWRQVEEDNFQLYLMNAAAALGFEPDEYIEATYGVSEGMDTWTEEEWRRYYNRPEEVVARLTQAVEELSKPQQQMLLGMRLLQEEGPRSEIVVNWALDMSRSLRSMWPRLNERARRRTLIAIYEMARPTLEEMMSEGELQ